MLGVCDRKMHFIYVLAGWEGSATDGRVLRDAAITIWLAVQWRRILIAVSGVRYHLKEWKIGRNSSQNHEEFFNMKHAYARNVIEREGSRDEEFREYTGTVDSNPIWNTWRYEIAKSMYNKWHDIP
ncbi:hypothetical protein Sango_2492000 [Sesamum angolense]|uniref:Uncharacterized protein n=1 Tax=Sesamum angolense TaxID=2727404 RepID=A0AAE1W422_9LAMI|nr:hypothetical protein Sango_2492000 [Sesamum angolense]